jgi:hypothetical protein
MPYIGKQPLTGAYQLCDTITTSATATYNLLVGGSAVIPGSANNCIVSLNGVVQAPVSAFTVSGSTITFSSTLSSSDVIDFILILGNVFDIGTPTNGSVGTSQLATNLTVTHALGAVGTPSITFTGDTNTGIYSPTADTIAFTEGGTEVMRIDSDGDVGINTTSPETKLHVKGTSNTVAPIQVQGLSTNGTNLFCDRFSSTESGINLGLQWSGGGMVLGSFVKPSTTSDSDATGYISSYGAGSIKRSAIVLDGGSGIIKFLNTNTSATVAVDTAVAMSERMRIANDGYVIIGRTTTSSSTPGVHFSSDGQIVGVRGSDYIAYFNRQNNDGNLVLFAQGDVTEGTISVSGATVSYNGFTGSHWSRFIDESKPDVLRGTVMESLDQMTDWYHAEFTDSENNLQKKPYALKANEQEGDVITYNFEGTDYQATIVKQKDVKHVMSKISDTSEAKNVYGVFHAWDNDDLINNDFYVASVGSYVVRIKAGQTVSKGDLLQSNGDGTAKVQADDIIRASTFAKVLSNTVIQTYEDGSFIVPCSLMC